MGITRGVSRLVLTVLIALSLSLFISSLALASGWWQTGSSLDPVGSYWWDQNSAEIYTMTSVGGSVLRRTTNAYADIQPASNLTYSKLAFSSNRDGNYEIYIMNPDGTGQTRLTTEAHDDMEPTFSADGTKIAFVSKRDGNNEIYVGTLNGGQTAFTSVVRLTNNSADDREPGFSDTASNQIVYSSNSDGDYEIFSMNATDGTGKTQRTTNTTQDRQPKWSPVMISSAWKVVYSTNADGDWDIHQMNSDGTADAALTSNSVFADIQPSYSSNAATISFASDRDGTGAVGISYEIFTMTNAGASQTRRDGSIAVEFMPSYGSTTNIAFVSNRALTTSPHGGFSTSSNLCKTCHAVHEAGTFSYRLLKNGTTSETRSPGEGAVSGMGNARATECMYCHDASSGSSAKKPYILSELAVPMGEHTMGATQVPDSNINGGSGDVGNLKNRDPSGEGAVLQCYQCHSVHGANTIGGPSYDPAWSAPWATKILRTDPSGDGIDLAQDATGTPDAGSWFDSSVYGDPTASDNAVRSAFCADCHNENPNWTDNATDTDADYLNNRSHPINTNQYLEVYGDYAQIANNDAFSCQACHSATNTPVGVNIRSRFPHQSLGHKLLADGYTTSSGESAAWYTGDPARALPAMDQICMSCHQGVVTVGVDF